MGVTESKPDNGSVSHTSKTEEKRDFHSADPKTRTTDQESSTTKDEEGEEEGKEGGDKEVDRVVIDTSRLETNELRDLRHRLLAAADAQRDMEGTLTPDDWLPDDSLHQCLLCHGAFGVFTRRHHCRFCGLLVCHDCSQTSRLDRATGKRVRVCSKCNSFVKLRSKLASSATDISAGLLALMLPDPVHQNIVFDLVKQQISEMVTETVKHMDINDQSGKLADNVDFNVSELDLGDIAAPPEDISIEIRPNGELALNMGLSAAVEDVHWRVNITDSMLDAQGRASIVANCIRAGVLLELKVVGVDVTLQVREALVVVENVSLEMRGSMLSGIVNTFLSIFEKKIQERMEQEANQMLQMNLKDMVHMVNRDIRHFVHDFQLFDLVRCVVVCAYGGYLSVSYLFSPVRHACTPHSERLVRKA
jgi:hypothetical protein